MNSVTLIGRLTKDPEMRYTDAGNAVCNFTLAVDRPFSKEKQTDFIRIVAFGKQAENCGRFLSKGRLVGVLGQIQTGSYKTQTGETRYTTNIAADRVEFLGGNGGQGKKAPGTGIPEGFEEIDDDPDAVPF